MGRDPEQTPTTFEQINDHSKRPVGEYPPHGSVDRSPKGTYAPRQGRDLAAGGAESPSPMPGPSAGAADDSRRSKTPKRKPLAFLGGGGVGGHVATVLAYHMPGAPPEVVAAYSSLLVLGLGFLAAYLVADERG